MKILATGNNTHAGHRLQQSLAGICDVIPFEFDAQDFKNSERLLSMIETTKPDLIVNTVLYTAEEQRNLGPKTVYAMNAGMPKVLASQANILNIPMIHVSMEGNTSEQITSPEQTAARTLFVMAREQGEMNVQSLCAKHVILRSGSHIASEGTMDILTRETTAFARELLENNSTCEPGIYQVTPAVLP